ncbi:hypothetical protein NONO_c18280 [Nocardia nova SH22a]|uniref:Uncharacterized protein n=1 Tax=Nocardia nova SH22a TaxID=1415166 RepID=W5TCB7_9NOCA|nr:hypothetical protein NONO_c18280 [Nocardia nova SH22a]
MSDSTSHAVTGNVAVIDRPTPMVLSVARRLRDAVARGATYTAIDDVRTVRLSSATDAQQAFVTFAGTEITVSADSAAEPVLTWEVRWPDPAPAEVDGDALGGFAKEVQVLLSGADVDWRSAAETFWDRVSADRGMPPGLNLYCFDVNEFASFGDAATGYTFLGSSAALSRMFGGRSLVMEELEGGELALQGSLSDLSALIGANLKVVCGEL